MYNNAHISMHYKQKKEPKKSPLHVSYYNDHCYSCSLNIYLHKHTNNQISTYIHTYINILIVLDI